MKKYKLIKYRIGKKNQIGQIPGLSKTFKKIYKPLANFIRKKMDEQENSP